MQKYFSRELITNEPNQCVKLINKCSNLIKESQKPIILFGAGEVGIFFSNYFKKMDGNPEVFFCDTNKKKIGQVINDLKVISLNELKTSYRDSYIVVTSINYFNEIHELLKENNLNQCLVSRSEDEMIGDLNCFTIFKNYSQVVYDNIQKFKCVYEFLADEKSRKILVDRINYCKTSNKSYLIPQQSVTPQYFDPSLIKISKNEVFIDGGAFTGDTVEEFLKQSKGQFKQIYSFEPEQSKCKEFSEKFNEFKNIELFRCGLWSEIKRLKFNATNDGASGLNISGNIEVPVTSIDSVLNRKPVTFIKLDIEGAELEALKGAEYSIKKFRPKLAICIYHNPLDIVEIPLYIKKLYPEYKIFMRHYSDTAAETICYAIAD
ncbi:FkbM family methyltransferase [Bacillus sp. HMF5848]|uniref:FkbM family methyltransferase n=1 Tax=Bacillus sp. HMF5848 TaxID=2495421 RepID=UPI00163A1F65|nr:FkbM family methyltransferase [Bacillus sp. HMF5848]